MGVIRGWKEVGRLYGYDFEKYGEGSEVCWNMKGGLRKEELVGGWMRKEKKGM